MEAVGASACTEPLDPDFFDLAAFGDLDHAAAFAAVVRIGVVCVQDLLAAPLIVCHTFVVAEGVIRVKDLLSGIFPDGPALARAS